MNHRVFIAINLPNEIKKALVWHQEKIEQSFVKNSEESFSGPVRWTKKDNLHITLMFLGQISDEELWEVCKAAQNIASNNSEIPLIFNKIIYGPPQNGKEKAPRMVWVEGEKSEKLGKLQSELENALLSSSIKPEEEIKKRSYSPHVTLGRIKAWEWNKINPEERIDINEEINLNFDAVSIDIMESELKRGGGPSYTVLESCPFKS